MRRAFIFASGPTGPWEVHGPTAEYEVEVTYKHLLEVDGKPIIIRTIEQFAEHMPVALVTPYAPVVQALVDHGIKDVDILDVGQPRYLVDTIQATGQLWGDHNIGVCGDVWFSDRAVREILDAPSGKFFGRREKSFVTGNGAGEIFAWTWGVKTQDALISAIDAARAQAASMGGERDAVRTPLGGKWQLYRHANGLPLDQHIFADNDSWVEINDWTDDFDTPENWKLWQQRYERRVIVEPKLQKLGDFKDWEITL